MAKGKSKSAGVAVFLALFVGALGFTGVGHMYLGRFGKGLFILFAGWVILVVGLVFFLQAEQDLLSTLDAGEGPLLISLGCFALVVIMYLWQIIDAANVAQKQ